MQTLTVSGVGVNGHSLLNMVAENYGYQAQLRVVEKGTYIIELRTGAKEEKNNLSMFEDYKSLGFEASMHSDGVNNGVAFHTMY